METTTNEIIFAVFQAVILALVLERGLSLIFDYRYIRNWLPERGLKAPIAFAVAWAICHQYDFNLIAVILGGDADPTLGIIITAAVIAGGSAAVVTLMKDVFKITRQARERMK